MGDYLPLATVFLSGLFGLVVVLVTSQLSNRKEHLSHQRQSARDGYEETKAAYADLFAAYERATRHVQRSADLSALDDHLSTASARFHLLAPDDLIEQSGRASNLLQAWSIAYQLGQPKKIGDTGLGTITTDNLAHSQKAKEFYPQFSDAFTQLANLMRNHLAKLRQAI